MIRWRGIAHFEERTLGTWAGFRVERKIRRGRGDSFSALALHPPLAVPPLDSTRCCLSAKPRHLPAQGRTALQGGQSPSRRTEPRERHVPSEASAQLFPQDQHRSLQGRGIQAAVSSCPSRDPPPRLVHLLCAPKSSTPYRSLGNLPGCLEGSVQVSLLIRSFSDSRSTVVQKH